MDKTTIQLKKETRHWLKMYATKYELTMDRAVLKLLQEAANDKPIYKTSIK